MKTIYEKYTALPIDKGLLCLEDRDITTPYFCYPVNAKPIGFEGCILYCFFAGIRRDGVCLQPGNLRKPECISVGGKF